MIVQVEVKCTWFFEVEGQSVLRDFDLAQQSRLITSHRNFVSGHNLSPTFCQPSPDYGTVCRPVPRADCYRNLAADLLNVDACF
jgi:hypothetical protein